MAIVAIRIGSMDDIHQYDDADFDSAIETTAPMKAGAPSGPNEVLRWDDIGGIVGEVNPAGATTDHAAARFSGVDGKTIENSLITIDNAGKLTAPSIDVNGAADLGAASTDLITCTGRLIVRTVILDPQAVLPANRPAGSVAEIVYYSGDMYFCTDAATPTWKKISST
jgi:hypothetical protein